MAPFGQSAERSPGARPATVGVGRRRARREGRRDLFGELPIRGPDQRGPFREVNWVDVV